MMHKDMTFQEWSEVAGFIDGPVARRFYERDKRESLTDKSVV